MSYSAADKRIRTAVSSPRDLIAAVPYILGFHPSDSVVVISLQGEAQRIGLAARVDRSAFDGPQARAVAADSAALVVRDGGRAAMVVSFAGGRDSPGARQDGQAVHGAFTVAFTASEIEFYDSLHVAGGQWWSLMCDDDTCADEHAGDLSAAPGRCEGDLAFAAALNGKAPLPSREALVDSLRPAHAIARGTLAQAVERHLVLRVAARLQAPDEAAYLAESRARTLALAQSAAASGEDGAIDVGTEDLAGLLAGLTDVVARDFCLEWSARDETQSAARLWRHLARLAPPPLDAIPLTLFAWGAYREGNGALAGVALDRALGSDPEYRLAQILSDALDRAVEPRTLREMERALRPMLGAPGEPGGNRSTSASAASSERRRRGRGVQRQRRRNGG